ncbi:MAG: hypothetical protein C0402_16470 [Thermodesulfovibrio sp.]|nr:hypothetical protein [Thermodesulfovibrio sp.]
MLGVKHMNKLLPAIIMILLSATAWGESFGDSMEKYLPYLNGQPWPKFKVTRYIENKKGIWTHPTTPNKFPTLEEVHADDYNDFATVVLRLPDGRSFKTYNALVLGPYLAEVYSGDFNNDGIPDFVAIKPGSGNGLAAEYCVGLFAFSSGDSYRFTRLWTMGLGPSSLVIDPNSKTFRLIRTSFRQGSGIDKKSHSFFVHQLYKWDEVAFREDDKLPAIWIQFIEKANHTATTLLTPKLKEKTWNEGREIKAIEW